MDALKDGGGSLVAYVFVRVVLEGELEGRGGGVGGKEGGRERESEND